MMNNSSPALYTHKKTPHKGAHAAQNTLNVTLWFGCLADTGRTRTPENEAIEGEEGDITPDLLLKHRDATLATYV